MIKTIEFHKIFPGGIENGQIKNTFFYFSFIFSMTDYTKTYFLQKMLFYVNESTEVIF